MKHEKNDMKHGSKLASMPILNLEVLPEAKLQVSNHHF
jgi:hypothetical protein